MKKIITQVVGFVGLSGIGWLLDMTVFALLGLVSPNVELNNILSSWVGVTFVFLFATRKIFQNSSRISLKWKYCIYLLYQFILILLVSRLLREINLFLIAVLRQGLLIRYSALLSKILVTPITMILNFLVMKGIIEKL